MRWRCCLSEKQVVGLKSEVVGGCDAAFSGMVCAAVLLCCRAIFKHTCCCCFIERGACSCLLLLRIPCVADGVYLV